MTDAALVRVAGASREILEARDARPKGERHRIYYRTHRESEVLVTTRRLDMLGIVSSPFSVTC